MSMKPMINFGRADAGIRQLRRGRRDAPIGHNLHESLGKHLGKTQVVHATDMTDTGNVANTPIVAERNRKFYGRINPRYTTTFHKPPFTSY